MHLSFGLAKLNKRLCLLLGALAVVALSIALADHRANASGGLELATPKAEAPAATPKGSRLAPRFGHRTLREGMTGSDVKVLKGIVRARNLLVGTAVTTNFDSPTTNAVRAFQADRSIRSNGVVNKNTAKSLIRSMRVAEASWYGPGFYGNKTACGQTLRPATVGVAHKTLPCGSRVMIGYKGRYVMARVIDRGPYISGRTWDLTNAVAAALNFRSAGVGKVRHAVIKRR